MARVDRAADHAAPGRRPARVLSRRLTWVEAVGDVPLDGKGEGETGGGGVGILRAPAQDLSVRAAPRALPGWWQLPARGEQLGSQRIDALRPQGPVDERPPVIQRAGYALAESARRCLLRVRDRDQLQILAAQRHDHVGRAQLRVAPARNRLQSVMLAQGASARFEVCHREQAMVDDGGRVEILRGLSEVRHPTLFLTNVWR